MIDWRIYYADGSTFDSARGGPEDAPARGVLIIVQRDRVHNVQRLMEGALYYYRDDGQDARWYAATEYGALRQFILYPRQCRRLLDGETVSNPVWADIYRRATTDPDFPKIAGGRDPLAVPYQDTGKIES